MSRTVWYSPTTWIEKVTKVGPTNLNKLETGVSDAHTRIDGLWFNVKDYGAKGDGTTNDTAAIQAAIMACIAAGGGIVYFPPGIYICDVTGSYDFGALGLGVHSYALSLPNSFTGEIAFRGAGAKVSILKKTTTTGVADYTLLMPLAQVGYTLAGATFSDLGFDGAQTAANTPFTSGDEHFLFTTNWQHVRIERCRFQNNRGGGVYASSPRDWSINRCYFTGLQWNSVNNSITFVNSSYGAEPYMGACTISGNWFDNNKNIDISITGNNSPLEQVELSGNRFLHDVQTGAISVEIQAASVGNYAGAVHVHDNDHYGGTGILVEGRRIVIHDDVFANMNGSGGDNGHAILFNNGANTSDCVVHDCIIDTCTNIGIDVAGTRVFVHDNAVTGATTGIRIGGGTGGTATDCTARGNDLTSNTTALTDNGTATILFGNTNAGTNLASNAATPTAPSLAANWANKAGGYRVVGYWLDQAGIVHLEGVVVASAGAASTIFTLPSGFRPAGGHEFYAAPQFDGTSYVLQDVFVLSSGEVQVKAAVTSAGNYVSLGGISFRAA